MTSLKEIRYLLRDWVEDDSIDEIFANFVNNAIEECEATVNFTQLYMETVVVVPDSGVLVEPPLCREITSVTPVTTSGFPEYRFVPRQKLNTKQDSFLAEYAMMPFPGFVDDEANYTVSVTQGSNTINKTGDPFFSASDVGKRVMLDASSELYEIQTVEESSITVTPAVTSEDDSSVTAKLNPAGTRQFILRDPYNKLQSGSMVVAYQRKHPRVYSDSSMLLIPCPRSVAFIALQQSLMTNKYTVDAQRLAQAVQDAKHTELDNFTFKTTHRKIGTGAFAVRSKRGQ